MLKETREVSIPHRYGTTQIGKNEQSDHDYEVSIPHRYGTTK